MHVERTTFGGPLGARFVLGFVLPFSSNSTLRPNGNGTAVRLETTVAKGIHTRWQT